MDLEGSGTNQPPLWAGGGRGGVGAALPPFSGSASRSRLHLLFLLQVGGRPAPAGHASGKRPPAPPRSGPDKHDPDLVSHKAGLSPAARAADRMDGAVGKNRSGHDQAERTKRTGTEVRPGGRVRSFAEESGRGDGCEKARRQGCGGRCREGSEGGLIVCPDKHDLRLHWDVCYESLRTRVQIPAPR